MKTEFTLEFSPTPWSIGGGERMRANPLSICRNGSTLRKDIFAKLPVPGHIGHGHFVKGTNTRGGGMGFCADDYRTAVKMTISPEMWELLLKIDDILDSIRSHKKAFQIIAMLDGEGLLEQHAQIKALRKQATMIGRKVRSSEDDGITKFEM